MDSSQAGNKSPVLPGILSRPLKLLPASLHSRLLATLLNKLLSEDLKQGELDFLLDRSVEIQVKDTGLNYQLMFTGKQLVACSASQSDLMVRATLYDFMTLVSRTEDPDSLVFQRRLVMEGDTELGLALKNYLDALDIESSKIMSAAESLSRKVLPVYQRLFSR